ncbi:DUF6491 family protein [Asticcacaulis sp. AC402]|uniref:DUF6491 family protein n=1 Tax=Asticcacaulis sp. AC402 TaxID=1282361 RepID=UPI0003C3F78A|nr:DUF6491 family protein [Asticcacaulis sp. AC402]ESQ76335.1 hypothetical protein ABAC402_04350 [Asticcacaulis sp. AC402]
MRKLVLGLAGVAAAAAVLTGGVLAKDEDRGRGVSADRCVARPLDQTKIIDEKTLYIDDRSGRAVLLHMSGACLHDRHEAIGLEFSGGMSRICDPLDVDVTGSVMTMPSRCIIASVEALTPAQAKSYRQMR